MNSDILIKIVPIEKIVAGLQGAINISRPHKNSNVLKLSLQDAVRAKGEDILNTLIIKYNLSIEEDKIASTKNTTDFINERLNAVTLELSEFDSTAESVQQTNRLTDLQAQSAIYLQGEREIEANLAETNAQIQRVDYISNYLKENSGAGERIPSNIGIQDNTVNETSMRINALVEQRNKILKNSTEKNPTIVNLDDQIKDLKNSLNQSIIGIRSSNEIRLNSLLEEERKLSGRIYSAPKKQRQSRDITRQQNIKESLYLYLLEKREESAIAQGMSTTNAKIIDSAFSSEQPVSPKKSISLLSALILGTLLPVVLIYVLDLLDSKVKDKSDIVNVLDAPFLGDIPHTKKKSTLVKKVDYSPLAEAFRMTRTNIDFMLSALPNNRGKVIFVTSTTSKEGKSHTAINLASSLSYSNKKVLIIETDIRMPKANAYLKMKMKELGLTDFIGNPKLKIGDVLTSHESNPNLHLISSGTVPPNPAELLMSDRMGVLFDKVSFMYDYIVVDTAAVGLVTDTLLISKHADMFVYVVRAGYLDKGQLNVAKTMYEQKRLPNMAILLNDMKSKKGYGYGYGNNPANKKKWWEFAKS
jgi:capsular exopolysaccharide synthesis family protein